jgi:hypothetical protein
MMRKKRIEGLVAPDGTRMGDKIPNSKYVRSFCIECQQPIRVSTENILSGYCEECNPEPEGIKYTVQELEDENLRFHYFDDIGYSHEDERKSLKNKKNNRKHND